MTILEDVKELLEVDLSEEIYDKQLLLYLNGGIAYLKNNNVPIERVSMDSTSEDWKSIKEEDYHIILAWLNLYTLQRFDHTLMSGGGSKTTLNWIDSEMGLLINQLKAIYDSGEMVNGNADVIEKRLNILESDVLDIKNSQIKVEDLANG